MAKNLPANAGDTGSISGSEAPPEKKMATHSSIFAWEIQANSLPGREAWQATVYGVTKELGMA